MYRGAPLNESACAHKLHIDRTLKQTKNTARNGPIAAPAAVAPAYIRSHRDKSHDRRSNDDRCKSQAHSQIRRGYRRRSRTRGPPDVVAARRRTHHLRGLLAAGEFSSKFMQVEKAKVLARTDALGAK